MKPQRAVLTLAAFAIAPSESSQLSLQLLGIPETPPIWLVGGRLEAGQAIIFVSHPQSVYVINTDGSPSQIGGVTDILNDPIVIEDITSPYLISLRQAQALHSAAFNELTLAQLKSHEFVLRQWESFTMSKILSEKPHLDEARDFIGETWDHSWFDANTALRVRCAVMQCGVPSKKQLSAALNITLDGYPHATLSRN